MRRAWMEELKTFGLIFMAAFGIALFASSLVKMRTDETIKIMEARKLYPPAGFDLIVSDTDPEAFRLVPRQDNGIEIYFPEDQADFTVYPK